MGVYLASPPRQRRSSLAASKTGGLHTPVPRRALRLARREFSPLAQELEALGRVTGKGVR